MARRLLFGRRMQQTKMTLVLLAIGSLAVGCATEEGDDDAGDDRAGDDGSADTSDVEPGDPVNLDGRWILEVTPVRGTCDPRSATTGFDLTRLGTEDFSLVLINPGAPYFGSVTVNHGCDGSGDACFIAISLVSDISPAQQLTTFGLEVTPEGEVTGKMYANVHGGSAPCEHYYSVSGAIQ